MKISIILPLFDRRGTGWRTLEAALTQEIDRALYEVIVVLGGPSEDEARNDPVARTLLARCDAIVSYGEDLDGVENRSLFYIAGAQKATGDVLFLLEGHSVPRPSATARIHAQFTAHPETKIVLARRVEHSATLVARLCYQNSHRDQSIAVSRTPFGGEHAMRRETFDTLCAHAGQFGIFTEIAIGIALQQQFSTHRLDAPLCDHFLDWDTARFSKHLLLVGKGHFEHAQTPLVRSMGVTGFKAGVSALVGRTAYARVLLPVTRLLGSTFLRLGLAAAGVSKSLGAWLFLTGSRLTILAGTCKASLARGGTPASVAR